MKARVNRQVISVFTGMLIKLRSFPIFREEAIQALHTYDQEFRKQTIHFFAGKFEQTIKERKPSNNLNSNEGEKNRKKTKASKIEKKERPEKKSSITNHSNVQSSSSSQQNDIHSLEPNDCKYICYQLAQVISLIQGIQLFTKSQISSQFPTLKPIMYRAIQSSASSNSDKSEEVNTIAIHQVIDIIHSFIVRFLSLLEVFLHICIFLTMKECKNTLQRLNRRFQTH